MILAVNIGNSNIRFAVVKEMEIKLSWTINTKPYRTAGEFFMISQSFLAQYTTYINEIQDIVVGSVVPHQTQVVAKVLHRLFKIKPLIVTRSTPSQVTHTSTQMGTDLYANAVAAHYLYPQGQKIIVDFGTALTLTAVSQTGQILGVIIAPGVITSLNALVGNTAQLPDIELKKPEKILGMDTETCMQSGIINGYSCMVQGLIQEVKEELLDPEAFVISTGGVGHIYQPMIKGINVDDKFHTIKGLCVLYQEAQKH